MSRVQPQRRSKSLAVSRMDAAAQLRQRVLQVRPAAYSSVIQRSDPDVDSDEKEEVEEIEKQESRSPHADFVDHDEEEEEVEEEEEQEEDAEEEEDEDEEGEEPQLDEDEEEVQEIEEVEVDEEDEIEEEELERSIKKLPAPLADLKASTSSADSPNSPMDWETIQHPDKIVFKYNRSKSTSRESSPKPQTTPPPEYKDVVKAEEKANAAPASTHESTVSLPLKASENTVISSKSVIVDGKSSN